MKVCSLTPRLEKIAELISGSRVTADIGTDHAYLPAALIARGRAQHVIASDIKPGPLERARETIGKYNMHDRISLRLGSGLLPLELSDCVDTIVISGMGGLAIAEILRRSSDIAAAAGLVIMQPMSMQAELRDYLYSGAFTDIREYLVREDEKLYNIISAVPGCTAPSFLTPGERLAGRSLLKSRPAEFDNYISNLTKALLKKRDGLALARSAAAEELEAVNAALSELSQYS